MFKSILRNLRYTTLLIRVGGIRIFLHHLKHVFYYSNMLIGFEKIINTEDVEELPSKISFYMQWASPEDIQEIYRKIPLESGESAYELIQRIRFFETGYHRCCVGKITGTDDICFIQWLILPQDDIIQSRNFKAAFPELQENDFLLENAYTFEKYRGNGILSAAFSKIARLPEIASLPVPQRAITYISRDNSITLRAYKKMGFTQFENRLDRKLFYINLRTISPSSPAEIIPSPNPEKGRGIQ